MSEISYETYQRLGEGVRFYNMNLGHQTNGIDTLPPLNPFQGLTQEDIDEHVLTTLSEKLTKLATLLNETDINRLATRCDVSTQKVKYAREGVEKATSAVDAAYQELQN